MLGVSRWYAREVATHAGDEEAARPARFEGVAIEVSWIVPETPYMPRARIVDTVRTGMERTTRDGPFACSWDDTPAPPERTKSLDVVRAEASRKLAEIADQSGTDSPLHRLCTSMWRQRQEDARASLSYGDRANALVILGHALDMLALAPTILARNELTFEHLELLLQAA
jgi:hypothetical protein